jgi:hypothetical protein
MEVSLRYVQLRLDRAVKLARAGTLLRLSGEVEAASRVHEWVLLYVTSMVRRLLQAEPFNLLEEGRLLRDLLDAVPARDSELKRRVLSLLASQRRDHEAAASGDSIPRKSGVSSMSSADLARYVGWMRAVIPRPTLLVAILSRGLPDAILAGQVLGAPVQSICFSRKRLDLPGVLSIDLKNTEPHTGPGALLVDAHRKSGETLQRCWSFVGAQGIDVMGALVSQDDGGEEALPRGATRLRSADGWALITPSARGIERMAIPILEG